MFNTELIMAYLENVTTHLGWFTVAFVRVKPESAEDNLLGSGTLVCFKGKHAILTAGHVAEELKKMSEIGLCLGKDAHRLKIPGNQLDIIPVGWSGSITESGPDLALVRLPIACVGRLKAQKSFYELSHRIHDGAVKPLEYDAGIFFAGFVGEWAKRGPAEAGFAGTNCFGMLCGGIGRADKYWEDRDFDYSVFTVQCHRDNPQNYQGASGGGLWKVIASSDDPHISIVEDAILCGVAYWQTELTDGKRCITCHGYKSIYSKAVNAMT
jgi:hypothetical protein